MKATRLTNEKPIIPLNYFSPTVLGRLARPVLDDVEHVAVRVVEAAVAELARLAHDGPEERDPPPLQLAALRFDVPDLER